MNPALHPMTEYTTNGPIQQGLQWLVDGANWTGLGGAPTRIVEHLEYTGLTVLIALIIAVPIGMAVGHTGRGQVVIVSLAGMLRALPTLGMVTLFALLAGIGLLPPILALVLLAIPPILTGVYAGISSVDPQLTDAARAVGMTEWQVLVHVEVPNGLAVMLGGFRSCVLQVVATVVVVAYLPLGGLGRFLVDGLKNNDYGQVFGGAVLIAAVALVIDGILAVVTRLVISPGLQERKLARPRTAKSISREINAGKLGTESLPDSANAAGQTGGN